MIIKPGDFNDPRVKALLEYHLRGMQASSPPGHVFALDWSGLQEPGISFYTGWKDEALVAIGAIKDLGTGTGEIKSMRVAEGQAGKGFGKAMLLYIIAQARRRCLRRLSLETGTGKAFEAAEALYRQFGFEQGGKFANYKQTDFCRFYHLELS